MKTDHFFSAHMPEVDIRPDIESVFSKARAAADANQKGQDGVLRRQVIIVTPGRLLIGKDCPIPSELNEKEQNILASLVPSQPTRQIAVIAYTLLEALKTDLRQTIPFIDYLLGFGALGHSVWVFEGHASALAAGCRSADMLLVDSAMLPELEKFQDWRSIALDAMRGSEIKVISR